jgi:mycothiol system anti-sigma-R factor
MSDKPQCDETLAELYTFLDGELTAEAREKIAFHLDDCPPCGEVRDFEADLRRVIASKCVDRVPDELRARILAACTDQPESGFGRT